MAKSTLVSPVKIKYVAKNNVFGLKMMMKSGLEKSHYHISTRNWTWVIFSFSFGWPTSTTTVASGVTHLSNQVYDICIRRAAGYCLICYRLAWLQLWSLRPNKLQIDICLLINYTVTIFSSELIWIDWSTQKVANLWFSKSFFYVKNQPNSSIFFSLKNITLEEELLLVLLLDYFHNWNTLFSEIAPKFWQAPINPNQFW